MATFCWRPMSLKGITGNDDDEMCVICNNIHTLFLYFAFALIIICIICAMCYCVVYCVFDLFHIHLPYDVFVDLRNECLRMYVCTYSFLLTIYYAKQSFAFLDKQTMHLDLRTLLIWNFNLHSVLWLNCQNRWSVLAQYKINVGLSPPMELHLYKSSWVFTSGKPKMKGMSYMRCLLKHVV